MVTNCITLQLTLQLMVVEHPVNYPAKVFTNWKIKNSITVKSVLMHRPNVNSAVIYHTGLNVVLFYVCTLPAQSAQRNHSY